MRLNIKLHTLYFQPFVNVHLFTVDQRCAIQLTHGHLRYFMANVYGQYLPLMANTPLVGALVKHILQCYASMVLRSEFVINILFVYCSLFFNVKREMFKCIKVRLFVFKDCVGVFLSNLFVFFCLFIFLFILLFTIFSIYSFSLCILFNPCGVAINIYSIL